MRTLAALCFLAAAASAQSAVVSNLKSLYSSYKQNVLEGAAKFKDADMDFKPTPDVMSVKELLGHMTDANFSICAPLKGEKNPDAGGNAKKAPDKEALIAALAKSFDYCLAALDTSSDATLAEKYKTATAERDKAYNALHMLDHIALHYGNLITYMRMKSIVPPETERRQRR
jgi:uncharacterized damage-inducible protein DinB